MIMRVELRGSWVSIPRAGNDYSQLVQRSLCNMKCDIFKEEVA